MAMKATKARRSYIVVTTVVMAVLSTMMAVAPEPAAAESSTTNILNPDAYVCPKDGLIDFETFSDDTNISEQTFPGIEFTTTNGYTWRVGDFATGTSYNGKYPDGEFTSQGTNWAWLGTSQGSGRIDVVEGAASYFSLLVSSESPVYLEAYDESGTLLETAASTSGNVDTGSMDELRIERTADDISYVIVHDSGNFFIVDAVCTDAPGVDMAPIPPTPALLTVDIDGPESLNCVGGRFRPDPFTVTARIRNVGPTAAGGVQVALDAPLALTLVEGAETQDLGEVGASSEEAVSWRLRAEPRLVGGSAEYSVTVTSVNATSTAVSSSIELPQCDAAPTDLDLVSSLVPVVAGYRLGLRAVLTSATCLQRSPDCAEAIQQLTTEFVNSLPDVPVFYLPPIFRGPGEPLA